MKYYGDYKKSSISMADDTQIVTALESISAEVQIIIETGTYLGLGSTKMLSEIFNNKINFEKLYTCEVNWSFFRKAQKNLRKYKKTICLYGRTVDYKTAYEFIENDSYLKEHEKYPDIYIDDTTDPKKFYINELNGNLNGINHLSILNWLKKRMTSFKTELLKILITKNFNKKLLIVLDSAGGIGFLEFQLISELLKQKTYYLLLDDIHHIKHYRSYQVAKNNSNYKVIDENFENGWILVKVEN